MEPEDPRRPDTPHHAAACYEALRAQITGQIIGSMASTPLRGVGLALLLQHGVAAWWQAVRTTMNATMSTATSVSPPQSGATAPITCDDQHAPPPRESGPSGAWLSTNQLGDVVTLLAGLVLSARPSRPAHSDPALYDGASP